MSNINMAHLEHPPFFKMEKKFNSHDVESVYKVKFEKTTRNGHRIKSEVTPDSGDTRIEFIIEVAEQELNAARQE